MELRFNTKEESNLEREKVFLALSFHQRFMRFLELSRRMMRFKKYQISETRKEDNNFVIRYPNE